MKLKEIFKLMEQDFVHGRKTPCDIAEFLEEEYYSNSKDTYIKYADMDITHYIRSSLKKSEEQQDLNCQLINDYQKSKIVLDKIKKIINN